jgi:hypothetical protein
MKVPSVRDIGEFLGGLGFTILIVLGILSFFGGLYGFFLLLFRVARGG